MKLTSPRFRSLRFDALDTGCHVCVSHQRDRDGYIKYRLPFSRKHGRLHRIIYELHNGSIPDGMVVCHSCDNPSCCNPKHLFLGSTQENTKDMVHKKRHSYGLRNGRAKLTEAQILEIREKTTSNSVAKVAKEYGMSPSQVWNIKTRKQWSHVEPKQSNRTLDLSVHNDGDSINHQPNTTGGNPFALRLLTKSCSKLFSKLTSGLFRSNQTTQEPKPTM